MQGLREGLATTAPQARVVASRSGAWSVEGGRAAAVAILAEHPETELIWAANDNMNMGACEAVDAAGRRGMVLLSRDGDPRALELAAAGRLTATPHTHPAAMGKVSVRAVLEALVGRFMGGFLETATTIVTRETADAAADDNPAGF